MPDRFAYLPVADALPPGAPRCTTPFPLTT